VKDSAQESGDALLVSIVRKKGAGDTPQNPTTAGLGLEPLPGIAGDQDGHVQFRAATQRLSVGEGIVQVKLATCANTDPEPRPAADRDVDVSASSTDDQSGAESKGDPERERGLVRHEPTFARRVDVRESEACA
jgi:hypothetical protein